MIEQRISCENMGISSYITQKTPSLIQRTQSNIFHLKHTKAIHNPPKIKLNTFKNLLRKHKISLDEVIDSWKSHSHLSPLLQERLTVF